jgi:hypothetical protein
MNVRVIPEKVAIDRESGGPSFVLIVPPLIKSPGIAITTLRLPSKN